MKPTSGAQFDASRSRTVPSHEQVRSDMWAVPMPMPAGQHIPYSILYLLRDAAGGIHVVDPGWDSPENWELFLRVLADTGGAPDRVRSITTTHFHPDHLGMAERMPSATGAPLIMHAAERDAVEAQRTGGRNPSTAKELLDRWEVPDERRQALASYAAAAPRRPTTAPDRVVGDGERLDIPGFDLHVMWTPGHTTGSICLRDDARSVLITGDHVLPTMHAGLGLGGPAADPIGDYLASLDRVGVFSDHEVLPGHGYRFLGLPARSAQHARHHLRRSAEVAAVLAEHPHASVWAIASQLTWTAGWDNLDGFYVFSALAQTDMHRRYLAARSG